MWIKEYADLRLRFLIFYIVVLLLLAGESLESCKFQWFRDFLFFLDSLLVFFLLLFFVISFSSPLHFFSIFFPSFFFCTLVFFCTSFYTFLASVVMDILLSGYEYGCIFLCSWEFRRFFSYSLFSFSFLFALYSTLVNVFTLENVWITNGLHLQISANSSREIWNISVFFFCDFISTAFFSRFDAYWLYFW